MLRPRWSELLGLVPQRWPGAPAGRHLVVQVPDARVIRVDATVTVPEGQSALYRIHPVREFAATRPTTAPRAEPMLMLVKPTVIDQRAVERKEFPLLSTRTSDASTRPGTLRIVVEPDQPRSASSRPAPRPLDSRR